MTDHKKHQCIDNIYANNFRNAIGVGVPHEVLRSASASALT